MDTFAFDNILSGMIKIRTFRKSAFAMSGTLCLI